jgi:hypothetical protein
MLQYRHFHVILYRPSIRIARFVRFSFNLHGDVETVHFSHYIYGEFEAEFKLIITRISVNDK